MKLLSIDVGIKNLACCILEIDADKSFKILDWVVVNICEDEDEKICNAFDVIREKSLYGRKYMGIDRSTFLLNKKLTILHLWRTVKVKGHVNEVINKIKEIK